MIQVKEPPKNMYVLIASLIILVIFSVGIGVLGIVLGNRIQNSISSEVNVNDVSLKCINEGGTWVAKNQECEKVSEPFCRNLDGVFDACASPCRNATGDVICIQMCVQTCTFK
ncbi:MAG: hypothetical protein ABIM99_00765 [Candidatus Dojkabacteria bacterium]